MKNQTKVVSTRVTLQLAEMIEEFCRRDAHLNSADFFRDAIRHKLRKEAPDLYHKFLKVT